MALNEATLPLSLILYWKVKNIEQAIIVRTTCHISCFITFLASAIPTAFFIFNVFFYLFMPFFNFHSIDYIGCMHEPSAQGCSIHGMPCLQNDFHERVSQHLV